MADITYLQCAGALALVSGALGLKMSMFRLAGSPGEKDPESALNKWWLSQSLAAEWNPVVWALLFGLQFLGDFSVPSKTLAVSLTASRIAFATRPLWSSKGGYFVGFSSMIVTYLTTFLLASRLLVGNALVL